MEIIIGLTIALLIAIWVFQDARKRYSKNSPTPLLWFFGAWGLLIIFLPLYLIFRPKISQEPSSLGGILKKLFLVLIVIIVLSIIIVSFQGAQEKASEYRQGKESTLQQGTKETQPTQKTWHKIATFQGTGMKNTSPFTISDNTWRITWKATDTAGLDGIGDIFQIAVHNVKGDYLGIGEYVANIANWAGTESDTSYLYKGKGDFYLEVGAANCKWTIEVEALY